MVEHEHEKAKADESKLVKQLADGDTVEQGGGEKHPDQTSDPVTK